MFLFEQNTATSNWIDIPEERILSKKKRRTMWSILSLQGNNRAFFVGKFSVMPIDRDKYLQDLTANLE